MSSLINEDDFNNRLEKILEQLEDMKKNKLTLDFPNIILDNSGRVSVFKNFKEYLKIIKKGRVKKKDSDHVNRSIIKIMEQELFTNINWLKDHSEGISIDNKKNKSQLGDAIKKVIDMNLRCKSCSSLNIRFKRENTGRGIFDKIICRDCNSISTSFVC